ncbi:uncharacterized protein LOC126686320 [Mercurialis annua]|uniref:uncharacterized protein LOC126686320 n=1 Tax=Mercurialis annua TaxID=3986 RepID=UPI002160A50D|nr:uncharacterized protein LOC126686320 [Mercurialis annua]XP_050236320.1 uncharacterized protein LOC126686320 [Mercurialis annua]XP_050236329.1 uncharacterized protein LOC126686320 [Mercurialis annua]XP_050236333.1 uncharacterized protein LOC126686320 [Mercurialis annua]
MAGPPKKHFLPLLLFLSLFAVFFFSHYHPSLPLSSVDADSDSNFVTLSNNSKNFSPQVSSSFAFLIKVLAFNRIDSLSRCLHSLANANYEGDIVHLHVYIDHFPFANASFDVLEGKLQEAHRILEFVDGFHWNFGNKLVHYRTGNVGLQAQWLEAWWPGSDNEFAFVVEDDLEVSPLFYKFVKAVINNYYYNGSGSNPSIYGVSLQRPRFVPGKHGNKLQLDSGTNLFLYQLVGTWGQILFPKPWKEFKLWYDWHKSKDIKPFLDGMVTNGWYKKMGERIWTPWFIKFVHSRGYFNIYTNMGHERALSVSHRDTGVNYGKTAGPDSKLVDESSFDYSFLELQPLINLKWYDFCFKEVLPGRVVRNMDDLESVLPSVQKQQKILIVSIFGTSDAITRNLICHFERLNIQNYILMGPTSSLLHDLARRGHPVIDANSLLENMKSQKLFGFQDSSSKLVDVLVKGYVIKKCFEHKYDALVINTKMLFVNNDLFNEFIVNTSNDLYAGKSSDIFFVRSSSSARNLWTDGFLNKIGSAVGQASPSSEDGNFAYIVTKLLEQNGLRVNWVDESSLGVKIGANSVNQSSLIAGKMVYWSDEMGLNLVQKRLEELNMWAIDGDSSCTAVICHQS